MADEEDGFVDVKNWTAAPQDDSGFVDISPWSEKPKQKLADVAASLTDGKSASVEGPSTWGDIAKTLSIAPVKGPIHALGTPGDMKSAIDWGMEKVGVSEKTREAALRGIGATPLGFMARGPTSAQVQKGVEQVTGPLYEPKTAWGKRVGTVANAVTNPLSYVGSASLPAKMLLAGTSAAGSEAAGEAAVAVAGEGTALETPARIAGGLAGGLGPAGVEAALKTKPGYNEFLKVSRKQYKDAHNFDVKFAPNAVHDLQSGIGQALADAHFDKFSSPESFRRVRELGKSATSPNGYGTADIHNIKLKLKNISKGDPQVWQNGSPDYNAAHIVRKEIDKFLTANDPTKVSQNAHQLGNFVKIYNDANKNAGSGLNLERVEEKLLAGRRTTDASDALKPYNKEKQQLASIMNNKGQRHWYSPEQQAQMDRVISGTYPGEAGRFFGRAAPRGTLNVAGPLSASFATGSPLPFIYSAVGEAGRQTANASNKRQIGILKDMIREGAPAYTSGSLKPSPGTFGPQSRTPFPYINELSDVTGGEPEPPPKATPKPAPKTIPREDQKEIRRALDIARQLQGASRQTGGRIKVGVGEYTPEELDASEREEQRFMQFIRRVAPRGFPVEKFRRISSSEIEDRRDEGPVSEEEKQRRTTPNRPWPEVTNLSRQAGYDDLVRRQGKARGGKIKRRISPHVTIPETPATFKKQQQSLIAGRRAAMLFPHKSTELALPRGMKRMRTKDGLVHFNKNKLTPSQIRKASNDGKMNEILGMGPVTKEEALARGAMGERLVAVTERDPDGVEAKSSLGTEQTAPGQIAAMQETADPGDWVGVESPQETLMRRQIG